MPKQTFIWQFHIHCLNFFFPNMYLSVKYNVNLNLYRIPSFGLFSVPLDYVVSFTMVLETVENLMKQFGTKAVLKMLTSHLYV